MYRAFVPWSVSDQSRFLFMAATYIPIKVRVTFIGANKEKEAQPATKQHNSGQTLESTLIGYPRQRSSFFSSLRWVGYKYVQCCTGSANEALLGSWAG